MQTDKAIWLLLDTRKPGGIETHVLQLANGLATANQKVCVILMKNYGAHPLKEALRQQNIAIRTIEGGLIALRREIKAARPILIHTHGYKAGILGRLAARSCGTPVVSTFHAGEIPRGKLALYDTLDRYTAFLAGKVLAVSPAIAERLPLRTTLVDNFVNTEQLSLSQGEEIAFVGRLSEEKGPDYFLEIARQLPDIPFAVYGDGPLGPSLKKAAPPNLIFHGQQNNMADAWSRIGLLVMPSRAEGLPMAALEAMAQGIPVVASRVGALHKLIDHNINGWLQASGDINAFRRSILKWHRQPHHLHRTIAQKARNTVDQYFSSQAIIPQLLQHYRDAVDGC